MYSLRLFVWLALFSCSSLLAMAQQGPGRTARFCVWPENLVPKCREVMALANGNGVSFTCVGAATDGECLRMVAEGKAEMTKVGGDALYMAGAEYGLQPLLAENYGKGAGANYFSVALVPAKFCAAGRPTLASLKGLRSCHTGYRRGAGWTIPIGYMLANGVMKPVNAQPGIDKDAETAAAFFSRLCANIRPGAGPMADKSQWPQLCSACPGACSPTSVYSDYPGAVRGLMEGICDVAFTKETTVLEVVKGGSKPEAWSTLGANDLRLVCPGGGCAPISEAGRCNLGKVAAHAVVGTLQFKGSSAGQAAINQLDSAATAGSRFMNAAKSIDGAPTLVFQKTTVDVKAVPQDFEAYFTRPLFDAYRAMRGVQGLPGPRYFATSN